MAAEKKSKRKLTAAAIFLLLGNILFFLTLWLLQKYDRIYFDQLLYQLKAPSPGVESDLASSAVVQVGVYGIALTAAEILCYPFLSGGLRKKIPQNQQYRSYCRTKVCRFFTKRALPLALSVFVLCLTIFMQQFNVLAYVDTLSTESDFIEEHYVDPDSAEIVFPEKKRNLIYIFLESMENTFSDPSAGGSIHDNYIPELTALAEEYVNFSHTDDMGGALSYTGTTWTASAMVSQTSGVPVKVPFGADAYGLEDTYMPGVVSIGELLAQQGYRQTLLLGSDAGFHGREPYFEQHGNYNIVDINTLKEEGRLPEDYWEWWGFEDEKLFGFAREEILRLAESGEPFNFTMLTADTHFPDGYECRLCGDTYEEQYPNVMACSAKQISEFVAWIQAQPFYENTTIILSGDHLTMDPEFMKEVAEDYERTIYNCIIHAPVTPVQEKNRLFGTFDMFPTTLAALGADIEGDRLGLGTNLFSERATLTEQYGFEALDTELQKNSEFYNTCLLKMTDAMQPEVGKQKLCCTAESRLRFY